MGARVLSVNAGTEFRAGWAGEVGRTAIDKRPVAGPVRVGALGLDGDEQADKAHHGGPDQAVYAYAGEDLDWWAARLHGELRRELRPGLFGENLTTAGLDVSGALIGETWLVGDAVVQVTSPRIPCVVFRNWLGEKGWIRTFREARRPGAYLRVLRAGTVTAGDPAEVLSRPADSVTVAHVLDAYYERDAAVITRMTVVPGHNSRWDGLAEEWLAARAAAEAARSSAGTAAQAAAEAASAGTTARVAGTTARAAR